MIRTRSPIAAALLALTLAAPFGVRADESYGLELVATGLAEPVHVTHAGDGSGRLFIVERRGVVRIVQDGALLPDPFIDISLLVGDAFLEQGLLSIAFHPEYATNGQAFLSYTDLLGRNVLARYQVGDDPNRLDPSSGEILFTQLQLFLNHNGGHAVFGPDGYLYLAIGDGGFAGDPVYMGQNAQTLLGTIIRIDVDTLPVGYAVPPDNPFVGDPGALDEIWAYGLRNPWRISFDRATGDLYIADVGQDSWEEVNLQPADSAGGQNYGWNVYEGNHEFRPALIPPHTPYVFPVLEYANASGNCSITGGHVYRGPTLAGLVGDYVFGDYCSGIIWAMSETEGTYTKRVLIESPLGISSFGEDEAGEIYVAHLGLALSGPGAVYRIVST